MKNFIRNFKKQKTVGVLNITSMSLGIMIAIIIGLWAINEMNFDSFHKNGERMCRTTVSFSHGGTEYKVASTYMPFGEEAKNEFPDVEDMCRVVPRFGNITVHNVIHAEITVLLADTNFFSFFTFNIHEGDKRSLLSSPDRVVISRTAAEQYFPNEDAIGKVLTFTDRDFTVSGIMDDMPTNSSIKTDFVFPFFGSAATYKWGESDQYMTYFVLREGTDTDALADNMTQLLYREFQAADNFGIKYALEPLKDVHFSTGMMFDLTPAVNRQLIIVLVLIAFIILLISCINFVNLFISTSFIRAKAIAIKKTIGAGRRRLMLEFYRETAVYVLVSIIIGIALAVFILPVFNIFTHSAITIDFLSVRLYVFLVLLFAAVVLLAGSFPALYMTRFSVLETISGKFKGIKAAAMQRIMTVIQFTASIALLIVAVFMQRQTDAILSADLGFDTEHVLYVRARTDFAKNYEAFESEMLTEPSITAMTRKNALPTEWMQGWPFNKVTESTSSVIMEICRVQENYFDFFGMDIIEGENPFYLESVTESDVVINESAVKVLGLESPVIGQIIELNTYGDRFTVRGVVRDAHTKSLHKEVDPQVYFKLRNEQWQPVFFKISGDPQKAIALIESKWKEREGNYPFAYHFLDDTYEALYSSEKNAGKVFTFAMLITFIITVAGLFAMAYYATQRRLREVAIRKVYGATVKDIFVLLNRSFLLLTAIAFAVACPVAHYGLTRWLDGYVVKTPLNIWVFILVGIGALLITLLITIYQTWRAATESPAKMIRSGE